MPTSVAITWETIHKFDDLWWQHLRLRKKLFVDSMNWSIPHNSAAEWDQYDTASTYYIITHEKGRVMAASRLLPCNFYSAGWSYMIRDATLNKLDGIPSDIIDQPPNSAQIYEATRFTVDPELEPKVKNEMLTINALELVRFSTAHLKAKKLIALMPPAYIRWLKRAGIWAERIGPVVNTNSGERVCVIQFNLQ